MSQKSLNLKDVVLLNVVAVTSLRWLASAAALGLSSISLWVLAALIFFLPQGLAVAELSLRHPGEGGLYRWTKLALGEKHAFLCGWCYWVNNLLYFPALLLYVSGNLAFALRSVRPGWDFEKSAVFVTLVTLGCLWLIALLSIVGLKVGRRVQNASAVANWVPALIVVGLGAIAWGKYGSATSFTLGALAPHLADLGALSSFAQLCFALAGLELVSFFEGDVQNARRIVPIGIAVSAVLILAVYITGTLGILVSVPKEQITLVNGILLPIQQVGDKLGLTGIAAVSGGLIALAGFGATLAWFGGAARVPYLAGVDRYLPPGFGRLHPKLETPVNAILVQTAAATLLTFFATVGSARLESAYKVLVDLCLILYFIPYCYLFLALRRLCAGTKSAVAAHVGLATTSVAILTTIVPSGEAFGDWAALGKTLGGTALMLAVGVGFFVAARLKERRVNGAAAAKPDYH